MPTNYDRASLEKNGVYVTPISYSTISLFDNIAHKDQIEIFRSNIETIYETENATTIALSRNDKNSFGIIKPEWITYDEVNKTITNITVPPSQLYLKEDGSGGLIYPQMSNSEPLVIRRRTINSDVLVEWISGSRITAEQLNLLSSQLLGIGQENLFELEKKVIKVEDADVTYATPNYVDTSFNALADLITLPGGIDNANNRDKSLVVLSRIASENVPQAAASLKWDVTTSKLQLIGQASQVQNRLELLASDGTTTLNYFNPRGVLNSAGRIYYGATAPSPAPNAADTGLLWWNTSGGNQELNVWNGSSWVFLTVGAGSYVTLAGSQTISGVKTFSAGLLTTEVTATGTGLKLSNSATIQGSGASKTIVIQPTNSGSTPVTVMTAADSGITVAAGKTLDYDTLGTTAKSITCTLADTQTLTGVKTINTHLILGPSSTYNNQSTLITSLSTAASDGSNLVLRINGAVTTRYIKILKETDTSAGIEVRPQNQSGVGNLVINGPTLQNVGDLTLGATSRIRNLKNCRIPGSFVSFIKSPNGNGTMPFGEGLNGFAEATITCTANNAGNNINISISNTGTTTQRYKITWKQFHRSDYTTAGLVTLIAPSTTPPNNDTQIDVAGGAVFNWAISTSYSGSYNKDAFHQVYITCLE